jgi:hypothetical protein
MIFVFCNIEFYEDDLQFNEKFKFSSSKSYFQDIYKNLIGSFIIALAAIFAIYKIYKYFYPKDKNNKKGSSKSGQPKSISELEKKDEDKKEDENSQDPNKNPTILKERDSKEKQPESEFEALTPDFANIDSKKMNLYAQEYFDKIKKEFPIKDKFKKEDLKLKNSYEIRISEILAMGYSVEYKSQIINYLLNNYFQILLFKNIQTFINYKFMPLIDIIEIFYKNEKYQEILRKPTKDQSDQEYLNFIEQNIIQIIEKCYIEKFIRKIEKEKSIDEIYIYLKYSISSFTLCFFEKNINIVTLGLPLIINKVIKIIKQLKIKYNIEKNINFLNKIENLLKTILKDSTNIDHKIIQFNKLFKQQGG